MYIYIHISTKHTHAHKVELKTLHFNFDLILQNRYSPFYLKETTNYWSFSVLPAVSQLIMQVNKPTFAYKLAL